MNLTLHVWRQGSANAAGRFVTYQAQAVSEHSSFLEMLDLVNERLIQEGADPIDRITVRLDDGALATVAGLGLATGLLATAIPAASVLRLSPRSILSKGK